MACAQAHPPARDQVLRQALRLAAAARGDALLPPQRALLLQRGGRLLPWRGLLLPRGARLLRRQSAPSAPGVRVPHAGAALRSGGFLPAPAGAWRVPPGSAAGPCWWCGRLGHRRLGGHRHRGARARLRCGQRAGVPSVRGLKAALGAQRQPEQGLAPEPASARLAQVQPPPARGPLARAPLRRARRLARVSLPRALQPPGSARVGQGAVLRVLALVQLAPWLRVPLLALRAPWLRAPVPERALRAPLPGLAQGRVRRARQYPGAPGLALPRAFSQPRPVRSWIGHG